MLRNYTVSADVKVRLPGKRMSGPSQSAPHRDGLHLDAVRQRRIAAWPIDHFKGLRGEHDVAARPASGGLDRANARPLVQDVVRGLGGPVPKLEHHRKRARTGAARRQVASHELGRVAATREPGHQHHEGRSFLRTLLPVEVLFGELQTDVDERLAQRLRHWSWVGCQDWGGGQA